MISPTVNTAMQVGGPTKELIKSVVTSSLPPEEILERLDSYAIDWYLTDEGDLMIRYWHVGAEDFVPVEHVATVRAGRTIPSEARALEWLSRHLREIRTRHAGQWIAIATDRVVAASTTLPDLLQQVRELGITEPFITEMPVERVIWTTAYAR